MRRAGTAFAVLAVIFLFSTVTNAHGDAPGGAFHSFSKGRQVESDAGELTAPFDGHHGWFWRNRGEAEVTVTLKTTGEYRGVKRVA